MNRVFGVMRQLGIINVYQLDDLQAKSNAMEDKLNKAKNELSDELEKLSATNLDEIKSEIEQKYNENVK